VARRFFNLFGVVVGLIKLAPLLSEIAVLVPAQDKEANKEHSID
jgi:hypothetical protein